MRRVLLVTYHFPPSAASGTFRLLGFARHLPKFDWQVSVLAPPELPWEPVDQALMAQVPPHTDVHFVAYPRDAFKVLRWAAPWGVWLRPAWQKCRRVVLRETPDVVLTSGPPHCVHALGYHLKRRFGVPWIADFRDPWIQAGGKAPRGVAGIWARHWERRVLRRADLILANAPNATAALRQAYPRCADKIETLTNGYDPLPAGAAAHLSGPFRLVHAGELYAGRDPRPLFDAMCVAGTTECVLDIVGRTSQCGVDMEREIAQRGLTERVRLRGQVVYAEARQAMLDADILVLFDAPGRTIGVPAKVYEYLATGRPVLAITEEDSDTANILAQSGVTHRIVSPSRPAGLTEALADLSARKSTSARKPVLSPFTRENLAARLSTLMTRICQQPLAV